MKKSVFAVEWLKHVGLAMNRSSWFFGVALVAIGSSISPAMANDVMTPENYRPVVGKFHPDFTLPRIDNREPVSLSDYRGKKVLLIQFASW